MFAPWIVVKCNCKLPQKCPVDSQESRRLWGRWGGWSGRLEEAISNPVMSFIFHECRWNHHEMANKAIQKTSGNGKESGGSEGEADKGPLAPTFAEAVSSFEVVRYLCFYRINNSNLCRLGTFGERANLHSTFGGRESSWSFITHNQHSRQHSQLFQKVTFQVYMHAVHMYLHFTL